MNFSETTAQKCHQSTPLSSSERPAKRGRAKLLLSHVRNLTRRIRLYRKNWWTAARQAPQFWTDLARIETDDDGHQLVLLPRIPRPHIFPRPGSADSVPLWREEAPRLTIYCHGNDKIDLSTFFARRSISKMNRRRHNISASQQTLSKNAVKSMLSARRASGHRRVSVHESELRYET